MKSRTTAGIVVVAMMVMFTSMSAIAQPQHPGPETTIPEGVDTAGQSFGQDFRTLKSGQVEPNSLAGKIYIEDNVALDNVSVQLVRNDPLNFTLIINVTENVSNVSFYIQTKAIEASQNISGLKAYINGTNVSFYTSTIGNSPWLLVEFDHFSTKQLTFKQTSDEIAPGPLAGRVPGATAFANTTPLDANQTNPNSLAGKIRVDSAVAENMSADVVTSTNNTYALVLSHPNATNVTVYIQKTALTNSQDLENVTLLINGSERVFGLSNESGSPWVSFKIKSFSDKKATFTTRAAGGGGVIGGFSLIQIGLGIGGVLVFAAVIYGFWSLSGIGGGKPGTTWR